MVSLHGNCCIATAKKLMEYTGICSTQPRGVGEQIVLQCCGTGICLKSSRTFSSHTPQWQSQTEVWRSKLRRMPTLILRETCLSSVTFQFTIVTHKFYFTKMLVLSQVYELRYYLLFNLVSMLSWFTPALITKFMHCNCTWLKTYSHTCSYRHYMYHLSIRKRTDDWQNWHKNPNASQLTKRSTTQI